MKGGHGDPVAHPMARMSRMPRTESGRFQINDMLDTWVEPDSKDDKVSPVLNACLVCMDQFRIDHQSLTSARVLL